MITNYKDFRKAIDYLFTPGASANFYGIIGDDGLRRDTMVVDYIKTDGDIGEYKVRINYRVLKELDAKEGDEDMRSLPHPVVPNPLVDGWICPYCGKRVYSMEVHPCNQPYCGGRCVVE